MPKRKKYIALFVLLFTCLNIRAQYTILLKVRDTVLHHLNDSLYVAGNFNNWSPSNIPLKYKAADSTWNIKLSPPGKIAEFKFTRGNWDKVEVTAKGTCIENHVIKMLSDTTVIFSVAGWKDDFPPVSKHHTASNQVSVIDTAFNIPQLNRKRRIWIYLPVGYATSKKHYPVLYMHDGQNLFDEFTAGFGEWGLDECLDTLQKKTKKPCIVVGLDNGTERLTEYNPFDNEKFGIGEGKKYVEFLITTLKPFIDRKYKTLKDAPNTGIAGSSMGGLISYFAAVNYPNIFGYAGIFSPAFWIAPELKLFTVAQGNKSGGKFFFYIGGREGQQYEEDMKSVTDKLGENSSAIIYSIVDPDGSHNEMAWRKWFPEFYSWIMAEWTNYEIKSIIK